LTAVLTDCVEVDTIARLTGGRNQSPHPRPLKTKKESVSVCLCKLMCVRRCMGPPKSKKNSSLGRFVNDLIHTVSHPLTHRSSFPRQTLYFRPRLYHFAFPSGGALNHFSRTIAARKSVMCFCFVFYGSSQEFILQSRLNMIWKGNSNRKGKIGIAPHKIW
jgi:hypothetical protein